MPDRSDKLDACFRQGATARQRGRTRADNPHDIDTDEHREWSAGWAATLDLDEDQDPASTRIVVDEGDDAAGTANDGVGRKG